ncbi:hypothetical protein MIZ01_0185 [Sideroxyarcus emersonii]|uniref:DUF2934 domain-containing protein n=1 Tax=Sideroxyarcus emersonii TaxID=2764705 RepID=A0AAN1X883_9PROT|nr:DUF2934 domain-containing protein [Sideroxyarcus emersonii]BCK86429.1 hypothetical protein MIZ01_0185 [Sideroxyarcus emersonii]
MRPSKQSKSSRQIADIPPPIPPDLREKIEISAYYKSAARGFAPGYELDDWLAAEAEISSSGRKDH